MTPAFASIPLATSAVQTGSTAALYAPEATVVELQFRIHDEHAPAFRSAVEELLNELGGRAEGMHSFAQETAITDALCSVGALKQAVFAKIPAGDPHYKSSRRR